MKKILLMVIMVLLLSSTALASPIKYIYKTTFQIGAKPAQLLGYFPANNNYWFTMAGTIATALFKIYNVPIMMVGTGWP